jgi:hypothetical protein
MDNSGQILEISGHFQVAGCRSPVTNSAAKYSRFYFLFSALYCVGVTPNSSLKF